jgi:hypothetical protein
LEADETPIDDVVADESVKALGCIGKKLASGLQ